MRVEKGALSSKASSWRRHPPDRSIDNEQPNEAVESLARQDPKVAELVKLRFFGGLSVEETAHALGVTDRTARRYWCLARAWLLDALQPPGE